LNKRNRNSEDRLIALARYYRFARKNDHFIYLVGLFEQLTNGSLQLGRLAQSGTEAAIRELNVIRGVGVWTAELAVLTGLRRLDIFPSDDLGIRQIISQLYMDGRPAKRRDVERIAKRWGAVGALVQYFLMCAQVLGFV